MACSTAPKISRRGAGAVTSMNRSRAARDRSVQISSSGVSERLRLELGTVQPALGRPSGADQQPRPAWGPRTAVTSAARPSARAMSANEPCALTARSARPRRRSRRRTAAHVPGIAVGDAVTHQARLAAGQHLLGHLHDGALDAAAGHRAIRPRRACDGHLEPGGRRALDRDHRRQRDAVAGGPPSGRPARLRPSWRRELNSCTTRVTRTDDRAGAIWLLVRLRLPRWLWRQWHVRGWDRTMDAPFAPDAAAPSPRRAMISSSMSPTWEATLEIGEDSAPTAVALDADAGSLWCARARGDEGARRRRQGGDQADDRRGRAATRAGTVSFQRGAVRGRRRAPHGARRADSGRQRPSGRVRARRCATAK